MINIENVLSIMNEPFSHTQRVFINSKPYFLRKRSKYSDSEAIKLISNYGISEIIDIDNDFILEEFVNFEKVDLSLDEYVSLLQSIHTNNKDGLSLVHGDFSKFNTTKLNSLSLVIDYEHAHWGNIYEDLGRIILRETISVDESLSFLESYFKSIPDKQELRNGIVTFCYWQNKIRVEKNIPYSNVPLKRARRVLAANNSYDAIINAFKRVV